MTTTEFREIEATAITLPQTHRLVPLEQQEWRDKHTDKMLFGDALASLVVRLGYRQNLISAGDEIRASTVFHAGGSSWVRVR